MSVRPIIGVALADAFAVPTAAWSVLAALAAGILA
jgi:hypothetical protein